MRLHHLALTCRDVRVVADFYARLLGLAELERHHDEGGLRSIWLQLEGSVLMVERGLPHAEGGWRLPAFRIASGEREAWSERLRALGAGPLDSTSYTLYGRDPEGNLVALSHYPDGASVSGV